MTHFLKKHCNDCNALGEKKEIKSCSCGGGKVDYGASFSNKFSPFSVEFKSSTTVRCAW